MKTVETPAASDSRRPSFALAAWTAAAAVAALLTAGCQPQAAESSPAAEKQPSVTTGGGAQVEEPLPFAARLRGHLRGASRPEAERGRRRGLQDDQRPGQAPALAARRVGLAGAPSCGFPRG